MPKYVNPSGLAHYDEKIKEVINKVDTSTNTKVTQTPTSSNETYPLLLSPTGQTSEANTTSYFNSDVVLNPSTKTISANIDGNAETATKAVQDGDGNTITTTYAKGTPEFTESTERNNIESKESMSTILGKVKKYFTDLKSHAFNALANNLTTTTEGYALDATQGKALQDKIGSTDISAIGDGTTTGAISSLNSNLDSYKSYISTNYMYRGDTRLNSVGWYRIMVISTTESMQSCCIRLNFSIGNNWFYQSPTYIDFDVIIRHVVSGKQNICLPSGTAADRDLSFSKFRVYHSSITKKYYIDVYYTRSDINDCGIHITNKSPSPNWSVGYSPQTFISVDDTISDDCVLDLEYTFKADS